ncbi:MAG: hydrogenase maturation protease [Verrucomicrobia bacterium]|nr:hydrogenase maturation protease [Verrucomicrobiota bacterium]
MKSLILGYGNRGRRDDGVGWFVVEQLEALGLPDTDFDTRQQLEIELAETLAPYDRVIFVDAATPEAPAAVEHRPVVPRFQSHSLSHCLSPDELVGLCDSLFGRAPAAVLFSIRGRDFGFGDQLSAQTKHSALEVVRQIAELLLPHPNQPNRPAASNVECDHLPRSR